MNKKFLAASLFMALVSPWASASNLSYSYSVPYAGAGTITLTNHSSQKQTISNWQFDTNAKISQTPYGPLWQWGGSMQSSMNANKLTYNYSITEPNAGLTLTPGESKQLTFNYTQSLGPVNVGMNPRSVKVTINGQQQTVPVEGKCTSSACNDPFPGKRLIGYYSDWDMYGRAFKASQIPVKNINTVMYSFINFNTSGDIVLFDPNSDQQQIPVISQLREQYPYLNASISFGGWTLSYLFSPMANDPQALNHFVSQAVATMREFNFNGIDIDWEYPVMRHDRSGSTLADAPEDATNFVTLMKNLRAALNQAGQDDHQKYYLTIAAPGGSDKVNRVEHLNPGAWKQVADSTDYFDIMTYDFHGGFDMAPPKSPSAFGVSDFMSALSLDPNHDPSYTSTTIAPSYKAILQSYDIKHIVQLYKSLGVPSQKLILGMPAYGRLVHVAGMGDTRGLYQPIIGTPQGEFDDSQSGNTGMYQYRCIVDRSQCAGNSAALLSGLTFTTINDPLAALAKTPWGYDPQNNLFLTFDSAPGVSAKTQWAMQQGMSGVMFWELAGDLPATDSRSLLHAAGEALAR